MRLQNTTMEELWERSTRAKGITFLSCSFSLWARHQVTVSPRVRWTPPALYPVVCTSQLPFATEFESRESAEHVNMGKRTRQ